MINGPTIHQCLDCLLFVIKIKTRKILEMRLISSVRLKRFGLCVISRQGIIRVCIFVVLQCLHTIVMCESLKLVGGLTCQQMFCWRYEFFNHFTWFTFIKENCGQCCFWILIFINSIQTFLKSNIYFPHRNCLYKIQQDVVSCQGSWRNEWQSSTQL